MCSTRLLFSSACCCCLRPPRMASSSTTSRAADRRRQRAASAALAATDADDAVDVNNGTDAELRERLLGVRLLPASVLERIIALRPFDGKADMLQRVNDGQPSARQCIGAKLAQKLHVACLSNGDQLSIVSPISHTPISHTQQARIRFDLGELGVVDASGVDPWSVVGITIVCPIVIGQGSARAHRCAPSSAFWVHLHGQQRRHRLPCPRT